MYHLVTRGNFDIVFIQKNHTEIWLQRQDKQANHVLRITQNGFDWRNQLEADNKRAIYESERLSQLFLGRKINLFNIHVSKYEPVDEWTHLKQPVKLKHNKFEQMELFYLDEENRYAQQNNLFDRLGVEEMYLHQPEAILEKEQLTQHLRAKIITTYNKQQRDAQKVFEQAKPYFTYIILALNVLLFLWLELQGGSTDTEVLIEYGAKYNPAIIDGQWWRIISSMFLHIGLLHVLMNMLALHIVGNVVERIFGNVRFLMIYFISGIVGGVTSFALSPQVAAGASGAIFGLFGALLFFGLKHKRIFFQTMGRNVIAIIGFNIVFGLAVPQIDNGAHIGGLIGGFLAAAIVYFPKKKQWSLQIGATIAVIALTSFITLYGISNESVQEEAKQFEISRQLQKISELADQEEFQLTVDKASAALQQEPNHYRPELLFYRSYAYLHTGETSKALNDLEELVEIEPNQIPEAHYNLALIYIDRNETDKAKQALEKALELSPDNEAFTSLYQETFDSP